MAELSKSDRGDEADAVKLSDLLYGRHAKVVFIGSALLALQQLSGINAVFYFSSTVFKSAGVPSDIANISIGIVNLSGSIVAMILMDRLGRKSLLLGSFFGMALKFVSNALTHDTAEVRAAACICLKNISRSVKYLSAGHFMTENILIPLIQLLYDASTSVQIAALGAISNIVVDFTMHKSIFIICGGVKQLVQLSKSMDSTIRLNVVWALRNLMFLVDSRCKDGIYLEHTASTLTSLICDPKPSVQEQALALVRNLVDGPVDSVEYVLAEDGLLLHAVGRQLQSASKPEVLIQAVQEAFSSRAV